MLRNYDSNDIFTLVILANLLLVVIVRQAYTNRFSDYLSLLWNVRYLKLHSKERKPIDVFNIGLFTNFLLVISLFGLLSATHFIKTSYTNKWLIVYLFLGIVIFAVLKSMLERLIGFFFDISELIGLYIFNKITYYNYSGLVLIGINMLLLFSDINKYVLIYLGIVLIIIINLVSFLRILRLYQNAIITNIFYFLLYLCALEIGPYVILYKAIKDYFG